MDLSDTVRKPATWIVAGLVMFGALIVVLHIDNYPKISPIDELQHIDYTFKVIDGHLVAAGDKFGERAMREEVCRGIDSEFDKVLPDCEAPDLRPSQFQEGGYNTAYIHPPTYYVIGGVIGRAIQEVAGASSLVSPVRSVGALWLAAAVILMWILMGDFSIPFLARAALIVLVITSPAVIESVSTVQPDGTALAIGAAMVLATLRWEKGRWHWLVPALIGAFGVLLKITNGIVVGACVLYLVIRFVEQRLAARNETDAAGETGAVTLRTRVIPVAGIVAAVVVAAFAWNVVQHSIEKIAGTDLPTNKSYEVDSLKTDAILDSVGDVVTPLRVPYLPRAVNTVATRDAWHVVNAGLFAGTIIGAIWAGRRSRLRALGGATLLMMVVVGPFFTISNFALFGIVYEHGIAPRYGLSLVPAAILVTAVCLERSRWLLYGVSAYAVWVAVITLVAVAG